MVHSYDILTLTNDMEYSFNSLLEFLSKHIYRYNIVFQFYAIISFFWFIYFSIKKFTQPYINTRSKRKALILMHKYVFENNIMECIRLMEKFPEIINEPLPPDMYTPFLRACLLGNTQLVSLMLKFGANVEIKTARNESPFYLAVYNLVKNPTNKDASCIHCLYYTGVDINFPNNKGYTPLQLAAVFGHAALVKWLLTKGANVNVTPHPYLLARMQGHMKTANLLKNFGLKCLE